MVILPKTHLLDVLREYPSAHLIQLVGVWVEALRQLEIVVTQPVEFWLRMKSYLH